MVTKKLILGNHIPSNITLPRLTKPVPSFQTVTGNYCIVTTGKETRHATAEKFMTHSCELPCTAL